MLGLLQKEIRHNHGCECLQAAQCHGLEKQLSFIPRCTVEDTRQLNLELQSAGSELKLDMVPIMALSRPARTSLDR